MQAQAQHVHRRGEEGGIDPVEERGEGGVGGEQGPVAVDGEGRVGGVAVEDPRHRPAGRGQSRIVEGALGEDRGVAGGEQQGVALA